MMRETDKTLLGWQGDAEAVNKEVSNAGPLRPQRSPFPTLRA